MRIGTARHTISDGRGIGTARHAVSDGAGIGTARQMAGDGVGIGLLRHIFVVGVSLFLLLGMPMLRTGVLQRGGAGVDAVSSASVILEQPSGAYVVFLNKNLHSNKENLEVWNEFFSGNEIEFLFEDLSCVVADSDAAGLELAKSFQSRLPENQMRLRTEDATLLLSKAEYGKFDCIVMSHEAYEAYGAKSLAKKPFVDRIESEGL